MASIDLDAQERPGGYRILLPSFLADRMRVEGSVVCPSPWGSPTVMGLRGRTSEDQELLCLINEYPVPWLRPEGRIAKSQLDLFHLYRLAGDASAATGYELFDRVRTADGDSPDLIANTAEGTVRWAITACTIDERVRANDLLLAVRGRVPALPRTRLGHLRGYFINIWMGRADDKAGLPFGSQDETTISGLVEGIAAFRPDPSQFGSGADRPHQRLVHAGPVRTAAEARYYTTPLLAAVPTSLLFTLTGFELGLAFQSDHSRPAAWCRLQERIRERDVAGNDLLLLTAGAPDELGQLHPAEEALVGFMLEHPQPIVTTHLKGVIVHFWSTGQAWNLSTNPPQPLWSPLYTGVVPPAQPFAAVARPPVVPAAEMHQADV